MGYKMVIHSAGGPTGHFAVEILDVGNESHIKGFYPSREDRIKSATTLPVEGEIKDDRDRIDEGRRNGSILSSKEISLTKAEYDRAQAYFDKVEKNPGHYDLNGRNCVDFANGALRAAGTGKDLGNILTDEQKSQMTGAAVYRKLAYPEDGGLHFDMPPKPGVEEPTGAKELRYPMTPAPIAPDRKSGAETPQGGLANEAAETAQAMDGGSEQTANSDARIRAMRKMAASPIDHPGRSALLKPVDKWTESEMKGVLNAAQGDFTGWQSGDPLKARMYEAVQDWHSNTYGDGPQQLDGGKPVEPSPIKPLNIVAMPHATPEGEDLWQASARMGDKLGTIAESDGYAPSVKAMQRGLNMLSQSATQPERSSVWGPYTPQETLKVDGVYGPKTDFAVKDTLARFGSPKADDALALGRFGNFADRVKQSGSAEGLDRVTGAIFGGSEAPSGVLQATLNTVGGDSIDGWQDLKVDDWIGPRTTAAFAQVLDQADPEDFTRSFGQGLELL